MMLTLGSLFSGIGGFELGLERAGMRCIWQSEIDPYASAVLRKHWPDIPNHGDIRNIRAGTVERPDVICGGFPCQDISNAGKRAGIDGERSGLWGEFARVIGELRPEYVVVENVAALLGRGIGRVLGDLAALGFDAEWHCIPASAVGAPHRRDRVWIIAYAISERIRRDGRAETISSTRGSEGAEQERKRLWVDLGAARQGADVADAECLRESQSQGSEQIERRRSCDCGLCDSNSARLSAPGPEPVRAYWQQSGGVFAAADWWRTEPDLGRVAHGVPSRVDRLRCLGNAIVPQVAEVIGRAIVRIT